MNEVVAADLADEFEENGLYDLAEFVREHGIESAKVWIDNVAMVRAIEEDRLWHHGEGYELHNLSVARDMLNDATA